ncbi:MAG: DUF5671 domain-containing protein [bacterium]|nr:DUF5671 domain-containing protein [bacterium]MDO8742446.1 DUF5671 domain-containing protein [bacterium]
MEKPKTTPKDFFLWAGALITFYWSVIATILLVINYIDYTFTNVLARLPDPYQSGISYQMASIIVLFPLYMFLMHLIRKDAIADPSRNEIWVRRWALILTLFVSGVAIAADLITLLTTFLNGEELTTSFLLKVLVILLVAAGVFMHFIADLKGYWDMFPKRKQAVSIGVAMLAVVVIVSGFFIVGTPQQARLARMDMQRISALQNIQDRVVSYWQAKRALPAGLSDLENAIQYGPLPTDPQTDAPYAYNATGALTFKLCATFATQGSGTSYPYYGEPVSMGIKEVKSNWQHAAGEVCFERTIDPNFFPPLTK